MSISGPLTERRMIGSDPDCEFVRADESNGLAVIPTSPDLLQAVGLPARGREMMILPQTRKDGRNEYPNN